MRKVTFFSGWKQTWIFGKHASFMGRLRWNHREEHVGLISACFLFPVRIRFYPSKLGYFEDLYTHPCDTYRWKFTRNQWRVQSLILRAVYFFLFKFFRSLHLWLGCDFFQRGQSSRVSGTFGDLNATGSWVFFGWWSLKVHMVTTKDYECKTFLLRYK